MKKEKGNNNFHFHKKQAIKNPPKGVLSGSWVERTSNYGNHNVTKNKKYLVRNYFKYLNNYGQPGDRYCMWDEFITIKNDEGWTVKMNLIGFTPC